MKNQIIASFERYNERRYSRPWVCKMGDNGTYNFDDRIGVYTGGRGSEGGDLVVFEPVIGQVYGYGQKDHRGGNTMKNYAKWDGEKFVPCDILGRVKSHTKGDNDDEQTRQNGTRVDREAAR